jgi:choline dehydrogenase-like flavoprotein
VIVDARSLDGSPTLRSDVVIVGGGVAGITMALELERRGIDSILLESGGLGPDPATRDLNRGLSTELPYLFADGSRSRFLGGSSNCWGGWCRPFERWDFETRPWVAHSGWPWSSDEIEPYYRRTHEYLDLGAYDYDLARVVDAIGHPDVTDLPLRDERVTTSISRFSPPTRMGVKYRVALADSRRVRTFLHANVVGLDAAPEGRTVVAVRCRTLWGESFRATGRIVVLAAGGIENPRLLLASNDVHRAGIGNGQDLVGRYFMDHPRLLSAAVDLHGKWARNLLFDAKFHDRNDHVMTGGTHVAAAMSLPFAVQQREQITNARVWFSSMFPGDHTAAADALVRLVHRRQQRVPPELTLGRDLMTMFRHPVSAAGFSLTRRHRPRWLIRGVKLQAIVEPEPDPNARVTLAPRDRDALGMPRVQVGWKLSSLVRRTFDRTFALVAAELRRAGVADVVLDSALDGASTWPSSLNPHGTWHHIGTTRMARTPATGVVDGDGRVFGVDNLYVTGSSVFPTASANFPTQMICALAVRTAEHVAGRLRADGATSLAAG